MSDDAGSGRPRWSVSRAAKHAGVARSTIQRYLAQGRMPGAQRLPDGTWSIGVEDLLGAGFRVDVPTPPDGPAEGAQRGPAEAGADDGAEPAHRRIAELEAALADAQRRAEVAEAIARERADRIADLRQTIAALEVGNSDRSPAAPSVPAPRQRGLLGRLVTNLGL